MQTFKCISFKSNQKQDSLITAHMCMCMSEQFEIMLLLKYTILKSMTYHFK